MSQLHIRQATRCLQQGGVIAYPTEAVWGLGCDPWDEAATGRLLQIKQRPVEKGMILIAGSMEQVDWLLSPLSDEQRQQLRQSWPGPVTWLIPDLNAQVPEWIKGQHQSVAVRVSAHPLVVELCAGFGGPIVSTSANRANKRPARSRVQLEMALGPMLDYIVPGALGTNSAPSRIMDLLTGKTIRAG